SKYRRAAEHRNRRREAARHAWAAVSGAPLQGSAGRCTRPHRPLPPQSARRRKQQLAKPASRSSREQYHTKTPKGSLRPRHSMNMKSTRLSMLLAASTAVVLFGGNPTLPQLPLINRLDAVVQRRFADPLPAALGMSRIARPSSFGDHFRPSIGAETDFKP